MTTSPDAGDDLLRILDDLDQLITGARSVPMSGSAIVNREEALTLIEHARHAVPRNFSGTHMLVRNGYLETTI